MKFKLKFVGSGKFGLKNEKGRWEEIEKEEEMVKLLSSSGMTPIKAKEVIGELKSGKKEIEMDLRIKEGFQSYSSWKKV